MLVGKGGICIGELALHSCDPFGIFLCDNAVDVD